MRYRTLGVTGIEVSIYCLGAMMFGSAGNRDHEEAARVIHAALDSGINFLDTADMYSDGESERIVGKALKGRRDEVVLATKGHFRMGEGPNRRGNSRRWIMTAVEQSLERLQTDWIDLYQIHRPDESTDIEETLSVLSDLVSQGKIRAFGCSTFPPEQIIEAHWVAERRALKQFRTEQAPYSLLARGIEASVLAHPAVTSVIIGPRTLPQLEQLLSGAALALDDQALDRIDKIVAPGSNHYRTAWRPPGLDDSTARRRPLIDRSAA